MIGREKQKQNGFLDVNQFLDMNLFLDMNPCNSKRNRGFFSNGKWRAIDMLVDHESGTDNPVGEVNAK